MLLEQGGPICYRVFGRDRPVRLHRDRQTIVVGALTDTRLGDGEVGATDRVVDRIDTHQIHRQRAIGRMLRRLHVPAALVHVQLATDLAVLLQREQQVIGIDDVDRAMGLDIPGVDGARLVGGDIEHRLVHVIRKDERELFEPPNDLVDIFDDPRNRLVLVHHSFHAEPPDGRTTQRREQHAP